jgi:hypothetical protein
MLARHKAGGTREVALYLPVEKIGDRFMPSPFPGMDPYLEAPDVWADFQDRFAGQISAELNRALPAPHYARLEMRPEVGIVEEETVHSEPIRHAFVEIRDPSRRHKLITLIEIASPSNKRPGMDRRAYVQKQARGAGQRR